MGNLESNSHQRLKRNTIQKVILASVELAGVLALDLVAPKATSLLKSFGYDPKNRRKEIIKQARIRLVEKEYLVYKDGFLKLTEKGKMKLALLEMEESRMGKRKKWDGRWRVLIFDIPEYRKSIRDKVRTTLVHIGFMKLQNSVWLYPYDCEDLVVLLKADFKIGKDLLYLIVDSIENDKNFRQAFKLPPAL